MVLGVTMKTLGSYANHLTETQTTRSFLTKLGSVQPEGEGFYTGTAVDISSRQPPHWWQVRAETRRDAPILPRCRITLIACTSRSSPRNAAKHLSPSLLGLRLTVFLAVLMWVLDKFTRSGRRPLVKHGRN